MIVTEGLSKKFNDFLAVDGVTINVEAGEVLALLGPNGAGKTTTVRMLTSVLAPSSGWAKVSGFDVVEQPEMVRGSVGVLTENHGLYQRMYAHEYLDFYGELYGLEKNERILRSTQLLEDFDLADTRSLRIGEYSKGMRQKLALARALLHNPPVLLLDEPTSAMDPESARLVRDSIHELRSAERSIIICTHNLAEAEELADRIAIIRRGKIIAKGSPTELKLDMLGPPEYEVNFGIDLNGQNPEFPDHVEIKETGNNWIRYWTGDPQKSNSEILRKLLDQEMPVVSLREVPRSLEQVYLQAVNAQNNEEGK